MRRVLEPLSREQQMRRVLEPLPRLQRMRGYQRREKEPSPEAPRPPLLVVGYLVPCVSDTRMISH
uniref:Uncharacterized protein n=1 Tax=Peronospora matthiolae TaxID=2874970 RepID=A0AAV1UDB3_9STRA